MQKTRKNRISTRGRHIIPPEHELRFEVEDQKNRVTLELTNGMAEIFGSQLVTGKKYQFGNGAKIAVFSYQGCVVHLTGDTRVCYTAKDTPMYFYLNCHAVLDNMRQVAKKNNTRGPVTMIVGPKDVGKSSLCKILVNYAAKVGRKPTFVDLDISSHGHIAVPGTIGALPVEIPLDAADGFSHQAPVVFHFGHKSHTENTSLYKRLVSRLAEVVSDRLETNKSVKSSGLVINTCGWSSTDGTELLLHAVEAFQVGVIFVLDQDRLYDSLRKSLPETIFVLKVDKSKGVVKRSEVQRINAEDQRVREYFYGSQMKFYPHSHILKWNAVKIYKISSDIGAGNETTKLIAVKPGPDLLYHLLSVSYATSPNRDVVQQNVLGFYCVTNVDEIRRTITVLSPQPHPLPNTILLLSDLQFVDTV